MKRLFTDMAVISVVGPYDLSFITSGTSTFASNDVTEIKTIHLNV